MKEKTQITLKELTGNKKYRTMSLSQLSRVINWELLYKDFKKLKGAESSNKARILQAEWKLMVKRIK